MSETFIFGPLGEQDISLGNGTFNTILPDGSTVTMNNVGIQSFLGDNYVSALDFAAPDAAGSIAAAIGQVVSLGGGIVDARGFTGLQSCSTNMFVNASISAPFVLLLGECTFNLTATQQLQNVKNCYMIGTSGGGGSFGGTLFQWGGVAGGTAFIFDACQDCAIEGWALQPGLSSIGIGVRVDNTLAQAPLSSHNIFRRISIGNAIRGVQIGDVAGVGNDQHSFIDVYLAGGTGAIYGYWLNNINNRNILIEGGSIANQQYGIYQNNGSFRAYNVRFNNNSIDDVYFAQTCDNAVIEGALSTGSGQFIGGPASAATTGMNLGIFNNFWNPSSLASHNNIISVLQVGALTMIGNDFAGGLNLPNAKINVQNNNTIVNSIGNGYPNETPFTTQINLSSFGDRWVQPSGISSPIPSTGAGGGTNIQINGITQTNPVNFNTSTPAAPSGNLNVTWQIDTSNPKNVSAYVPLASIGAGSWSRTADPQGSGHFDVYLTTTSDRALAGLTSSDITDQGVFISNNAMYVVSGPSNAYVGGMVYEAGVNDPTITLAAGHTGTPSPLDIPLRFVTGTPATERMRIDSNGLFTIQSVGNATFTIGTDVAQTGDSFWNHSFARIGVTFNSSVPQFGLLIESRNTTPFTGSSIEFDTVCIIAQDARQNSSNAPGGPVCLDCRAGLLPTATWSQAFAGYFEADLSLGAATGNNSLACVEIGLVDYNAGNDVPSLTGTNQKIALQIVAGEAASVSPATMGIVFASGEGNQYFHNGIVAYQNALGNSTWDAFLKIVTTPDAVGTYRVNLNGATSIGSLSYDDQIQIPLQVINTNNGGCTILSRNMSGGTAAYASIGARSGGSISTTDCTLGVTSAGFTPAGGLLASQGFIKTGATSTNGLVVQTSAGTIGFQPAGTTSLVTMANANNVLIGEIDQNADTIIKVANAAVGTATRAYFTAVSDSGSGQLNMGSTGTGYTTTSGIASRVGFIAASSGLTGGMVIQTGAGAVNFQVGGTTTNMTISTSGALQPALPVGAIYGGTGQTVYAVGDILYASATTTLSRLAVGTNGFVLTLSGGLPVWATPGAGSSNWTRAADPQGGGIEDLYPTAALTDRILSGISSSDLTDQSVIIGLNTIYVVSASSSASVGALSYNLGSGTIQVASGKSPGASSSAYLPLAFLTSATERARIYANGHVQIATASTTDQGVNFYVLGTASVSSTLTAGFFSGNGLSITNLSGTNINSGTVGVLVGGTGQSAYSIGDMLFSGLANTLSRLAIGTTGQVLTVSGGVPTWATAGASNWTRLLDSIAGVFDDLYSANSTNDRILAGMTSSEIPDAGVMISNNAIYVSSAPSNASIGALAYNFGSGTIQVASGKTASASSTAYLPLAFLTSATERMRIFANGHVAIGTQTDTGNTLYVSGTLTVLSSVTANVFSGSGSAISNLNGSNITSGIVGAAFLPATVVYYGGTGGSANINFSGAFGINSSNGQSVQLEGADIGFYLGGTKTAQFTSSSSSGTTNLWIHGNGVAARQVLVDTVNNNYLHI